MELKKNCFLGSNLDKPDFMGAPYEFWVGSNVGIGTSVGQIRVNDAMEKNEVSYDLLHSYEDGGLYSFNKFDNTSLILIECDTLLILF